MWLLLSMYGSVYKENIYSVFKHRDDDIKITEPKVGHHSGDGLSSVRA